MSALEHKPLLCTHRQVEGADECGDCVDLQYESYMMYATAWLEDTAQRLWGVSKLGALRERLRSSILDPDTLPLPTVLRSLISSYVIATGDAVLESLC